MDMLRLQDPTLSEIAREVPRVRRYCLDEQEIIWNNALRELQRRNFSVPSLLWQLTRSSFLMDIGEDRDFCKNADISYASIDHHWHDIRAAAALWYYSKLVSA